MGVTIGNDAGPASTIKFVMNPAYNCILNEQNVHSKFKRLSSSSHVRICSSNPSDFQELQWPLENNVNEVRIIEQIPFTKEDKLNPENITILVDPHSYIYPEDELESTDCADCPSLRTLLERPCHVTSKGSVKKRLTTSSDRLTNGSECDNVNINTKKSTYSGMKPRKDTNSTTEVNDSGPSKSSWILDMKTKLSTLAAENFGKSQNGASSTSRNMKLNNQLTIEGRTIKRYINLFH